MTLPADHVACDERARSSARPRLRFAVANARQASPFGVLGRLIVYDKKFIFRGVALNR